MLLATTSPYELHWVKGEVILSTASVSVVLWSTNMENDQPSLLPA